MALAGRLAPVFYGDSIAVGYGKDAPGRRREGASPYEILGYLQQDLANNPIAFQNKLVNLSTGVSNNPYDFDSIQKQLELLRGAGATVNILGASKQRYSGENKQLAGLARNLGFNFLGGFDAGPDQVHPLSYASYNGLTLNQPNSVVSNTPVVTGDSFQTVLVKKDGVMGTLNKGTNEFTKRQWTPEEADRYMHYLNLK